MKTPEENLRSAGGSSPAEALSFLWRGRWTIVLFTLLAAAAGVWMAEQRGTTYRARSVLYVQREAPMMPGTDVSPWLQSRNYANTQAALLRSTPVLAAGLEQAKVEMSGLFGDSRNHLAWLRRRLNVAVGNEDDLITVSLDAVMVDEACALVNAVVDSYLAFRTRNQRETAAEVLAGLRSELRRYEEEMRVAQAEQVQFLTTHPGVGPASDAANVQVERLRELNQAQTRAELELMQAETAWRSAKSQAEVDDPLQWLALQGTDAATTRSTLDGLQRLQELRQRRLHLLEDVTTDHPTVKQLDDLIAELEARVGAEARRVAESHVATMAQRQLGAKRLFDDLQLRVREQEQQMRAVDPAQAEYRGLEVRFERARKIADALYERVRSIDINESLGGDSRSQLNGLVYEYATSASAAVASSKTAMAAIATFLGLLLGIAAAWIRSLLDQRLRTPDDVVGYLPLLATLTRVPVARQGVVATWDSSPELVAAMRSLRTVIHFGLRSTRNRTLQVTSAHSGDGKSFVAAGLAIAMAQSGQRTLIVDADLGRPVQARMFAVAGELGLRQVMAQRLSAAAAITETRVANLHLLPAGERVAGASDQLDATRLTAVLHEIADSYDRIIVDSAPLLAVVDARIVAAVCDGSLLVVRAGRTTRQMVEAAMGVVASVAGRLCGAVMNRSPRSASVVGGSSYPQRITPAVAIDAAELDLHQRRAADGNEARTGR